MHCADTECPFYIRASWSTKKECVVVGTVNSTHSCLGTTVATGRSVSGTQKWLQPMLPSAIVVHKDTKPQAIIEAIQLKHNVRQLTALRGPCETS
jgi:hypothetical protein